MKRIFLSLAIVAVLGTSLVSCRETKTETKTIEVEVSDDDGLIDEIEDAADDVEDIITGEDDN